MSEFAVALVVATVGVAALLPLIRRRDVMDIPNDRSSHSSPTPRGGGVAVVTAVVVAAAVSWLAGGSPPWPVILVGMALAVIGFVDDLHALGGWQRLGSQLVFAVGLAWWCSAEYGTANLNAVLFALIGTLTVVGYVNAFNFMDGVNGISAINAAVAGAWFAWLGDRYEIDGVTIIGLAVAGASVGFLPWNAPKARIFLGDVGSYGLGALIAGMALVSWAAGANALMSVAPLVVYGADTGWVLVKRAIGGRPLMQAHREHVYQRLVDGAGWAHLTVSVYVSSLAFICCLAARLAPAPSFVVAAIGAAYLGSPLVTPMRKDGGNLA